MATYAPESLEQPLEPIKNKKWVLRVSFHCEGCKKKVKKILSQVPGVHEMEFDIKQQKVIVAGDVEADALLKRLKKYGKHALLLPENFRHGDTEKKAGKLKEEEKLLPRQESKGQTSPDADAIHNIDKKAVKQPVTPPPAAKEAESAQEPPPSKDSQVDGTSGTGGGHETIPVAQSGAKMDDKVAEEAKSKVKTPAASSAVGEPPTEMENKGGDGNDGGKVSSAGQVESTNTGKKNKNKGQNGNTALDDPPLIAAKADTGLQNHDAGPQVSFFPANHLDPRQHGDYGYQSNFYNPPLIQAVSYNMTYPSTDRSTSYYTAPPPSSYVYSYYAPEAEPLPSDVEPNPREPLDSFEMFSDENPNGCVII